MNTDVDDGDSEERRWKEKENNTNNLRKRLVKKRKAGRQLSLT